MPVVRSGRPPRRLATALGGLLAAVGLGVFAGPALAASGQIAGQVTNTTGQPVAGLTVDALSFTRSAEYGTTTGPDGRYVIPGLQSGSYGIDFRSEVGGPNYQTTYYSGKTSWADSDLVVVTDGATTSGIDAQVRAGAPYGQISGTLRDDHGAPVQDVVVAAYAAPEDMLESGSSTSDADGGYTVSGLPAGTYDLVFSSQPEAAVTFGRQTETGLTVTSATTTSAGDAVLQPGGGIAGTVTDRHGQGLAGVVVTATTPDSRQIASTDAAGRYTLGGLASGSYTVEVDPSGLPGDLVAVAYRQRSPDATPDAVSVAAGEVTSGIDAQLTAGGRITGTVTAGSGAPATGASVMLTDSGGEPVSRWGSVRPDGTYAITNLAPGTYQVRFDGPPGAGDIEQYYTGADSPATATAVSVTSGAATSGIDARLASGGVISGTVTDALGHPVQGVGVFAFNVWDPIPLLPSFAGLPILPGVVTTDAAGRFQIGGLDGVYRVYFSSADYVPRYYGGSGASDAATLLTVRPESTTDVDVQIQLAGAIAGNVTDPQGRPAQAFVWAFRADGSVAGFTLSAGGTYRIGDLAPGLYTVELALPNSPSAFFFDHRTSAGAADPVTVTAGTTTPGINAHFAAAAGAAPTLSTAVLAGFRGSLPVSRKGTVSMRLRCLGPAACAGTIALSSTSVVAATRAGRTRTERVTIGRLPFSLGPDQRSTVQLPLTATGRTLLRRHRGRLHAAVVVTPTGAGHPGTTTTATELRAA
jgi:hypothetical protein